MCMERNDVRVEESCPRFLCLGRRAGVQAVAGAPFAPSSVVCCVAWRGARWRVCCASCVVLCWAGLGCDGFCCVVLCLLWLRMFGGAKADGGSATILTFFIKNRAFMLTTV